MGSDVLSHVKCDIMVDVMREVLFLPFRVRAARAIESAWEQRRNEGRSTWLFLATFLEVFGRSGREQTRNTRTNGAAPYREGRGHTFFQGAFDGE